MASCLTLFGLVFLAIGFLASGISFCAPYWLYNHNNYQDSGLWGHGYCKDKGVLSASVGASDSNDISFEISRDRCRWRWAWESDWAWEKDKHQQAPWFIATQGLYGFGTVTLLFTFLIACGNLCCGCGKETVSILLTIGLLVLFAVIQIAAALIVFGIFAWLDWNASVHSSTYRYNWAFFLGIGAVFVSGFSAIFYLIESCRTGRSHTGYERGDVV